VRADLVAVLRCPVCADGLALADRTAHCPRGHSYDLAKQGYLNLLPAASNGIEGDSAAMVGARTVFLGSGHYASIRDALILAADLGEEDLVVEVGAGSPRARSATPWDRPGRVEIRRPARGEAGSTDRVRGV
jgi:23S rRNA (guanine745-N1)-methyltransferase